MECNTLAYLLLSIRCGVFIFLPTLFTSSSGETINSIESSLVPGVYHTARNKSENNDIPIGFGVPGARTQTTWMITFRTTRFLRLLFTRYSLCSWSLKNVKNCIVRVAVSSRHHSPHPLEIKKQTNILHNILLLRRSILLLLLLLFRLRDPTTSKSDGFVVATRFLNLRLSMACLL